MLPFRTSPTSPTSRYSVKRLLTSHHSGLVVLVSAVLVSPLFSTGCGTDEAQDLAVSEISVLAPLPGQTAAVAYFSLHNATPAAMTLRRVSSPDFASVEMHTTYFDNGVAHMQSLESLTIAELSQVEFSPGGHHLMLLQPLNDIEPGDEVILDFHYNDENSLSLRTTVKPPKREHYS